MRRKVLSMKKSSLPISVQLERHERLPKPLLRLLTRIFTKSAPKCPTRPRTLTGLDPRSRSSLEKKAGAPLPELLDHNAAPASYDVIFWAFRFGGMKLPKSSRVSSRRTISVIRKSSYLPQAAAVVLERRWKIEACRRAACRPYGRTDP